MDTEPLKNMFCREGSIMSKVDRLEWSRKVATLNERIKGFQENPSQEHLDAAIGELRSYAEAASSGSIEIPQRFIAN